MTTIDSNDQERIKLAFTWTSAEFKSAYKDYSAGVTRLVPQKYYFVLILIASLLYVLLVGLQKSFSIETGLLGACLLIVSSVLVVNSSWYQTRQFIRYRAALCDKTTQWEITQNELVNSLSDGTGGTIHWDSITSARKGESGTLLYVTPSLFYWFPYHAFTSSEDINRLEKLVAINVKTFHKVEPLLPRVVRGFLIAPLFAVLPTFLYNLGFKASALPALIMDTAMSSLPIAYVVALLFGVPLFLLLRKISLFNLTSTLISGVILSLLPIILLAPEAIFRTVKAGESFYLCLLAVNGLLSAFVFWLIIGIKDTPKNSRTMS